MILLVISFQAIQAFAINTYKILRLKSVNQDEKLNQSAYPVIINANCDSNGSPEGVK